MLVAILADSVMVVELGELKMVCSFCLTCSVCKWSSIILRTSCFISKDASLFASAIVDELEFEMIDFLVASVDETIDDSLGFLKAFRLLVVFIWVIVNVFSVSAFFNVDLCVLLWLEFLREIDDGVGVRFVYSTFKSRPTFNKKSHKRQLIG